LSKGVLISAHPTIADATGPPRVMLNRSTRA
jgi:hypothetical protein